MEGLSIIVTKSEIILIYIVPYTPNNMAFNLSKHNLLLSEV